MNSAFYSNLAIEANELSENHLKIIDAFAKNPTIPLSLYSKVFNLDLDKMSLVAKQKIFNSAINAELNEWEFWKNTAKQLESQSFIKYTAERGYKNFPKNR